MRIMFRLDNKVAVVTGAGSGIGNAIANTFAGSGAHVFILEANLDAGRAAAEKSAKRAAMPMRSRATYRSSPR